MGDDANQPVRYFVYADVMSELLFSADEEPRAAFAILRGNFGLDQDGGFVEITGFSGFEPSVDTDVYLSVRKASDAVILTEAGIARAEDLLIENRAVMSETGAVVGLFVSERGGNAEMTEAHAFLHYSLFNVPFQGLVVFDPDTRNLAMYARPPKGRFENMAFRWVTPAHPA